MKKAVSLVSIAVILCGVFAFSQKAEAAQKSFDYEYVTQSPSAPFAMSPGEEKTVWVEVKNTGSKEWWDQGVMNSNSGRSSSGAAVVYLGTGSIHDPQKRGYDYNSIFESDSWANSRRASHMTNGAVEFPAVSPGWNTRFAVKLKAPETPGTYREYFTPVAEGVQWMRDIGIYWEIIVNDDSGRSCVSEGDSLGAVYPGNDIQCCAGLTPFVPEGIVGTRGTCQKPGYIDPARSRNLAEYMFQYVGQTANPTIYAGNDGEVVTISLKNIGKATWFSSGSYAFRLGTAGPKDRSSQFRSANSEAPLCKMDSDWSGCEGLYVSDGWASKNRLEMKQYMVEPGQTADFKFYVDPSYNTSRGKYKEYFQPVVEGLGWLTDIGIYTEITVTEDFNGSLSGSDVVVDSLSMIPFYGGFSVKTGEARNYSIIANYSNGTTQNVTTMANFEVVYDTGTGTIDPDGRFIAGSAGDCVLKAGFGGKTVEKTITVLPF